MPLKKFPAHVSNPCMMGDHRHCKGRVALMKPVRGEWYVPCRCPIEGCDHPPFKPPRLDD